VRLIDYALTGNRIDVQVDGTQDFIAWPRPRGNNFCDALVKLLIDHGPRLDSWQQTGCARCRSDAIARYAQEIKTFLFGLKRLCNKSGSEREIIDLVRDFVENKGGSLYVRYFHGNMPDTTAFWYLWDVFCQKKVKMSEEYKKIFAYWGVLPKVKMSEEYKQFFVDWVLPKVNANMPRLCGTASRATKQRFSTLLHRIAGLYARGKIGIDQVQNALQSTGKISGDMRRWTDGQTPWSIVQNAEKLSYEEKEAFCSLLNRRLPHTQGDLRDRREFLTREDMPDFGVSLGLPGQTKKIGVYKSLLSSYRGHTLERY